MSHEKYYETEEINLFDFCCWSTLQRGDHIAAEAKQGILIYYHHGIFLGFDKGVADFGGTNKSNAELRIVDFDTFTHNKNRRLFRMRYISCLPLEESAEIAEYLVNNPMLWSSYSLLMNNCEHFATICKTNIPFSLQVRKIISLIWINIVAYAHRFMQYFQR